jgi:hypothetical protein
MFRKTRQERHNYIKNNNKDTLVKYFKELKQSSKINESLVSVFNNDKEYYINLKKLSIDNGHDPTLSSVQKGGIFGTGATKVGINMCDSIRSKLSCNERKLQLTRILKNLRNVDLKSSKQSNWETNVNDFVEYLVCCADSYMDSSGNPLFEFNNFIIDILALLFKDRDMTLFAHDKIKLFLNSQRGLQLNPFMIKLNNMFDDVRKDQNTPMELQIGGMFSGVLDSFIGGFFGTGATSVNPKTISQLDSNTLNNIKKLWDNSCIPKPGMDVNMTEKQRELTNLYKLLSNPNNKVSLDNTKQKELLDNFLEYVQGCDVSSVKNMLPMLDKMIIKIINSVKKDDQLKSYSKLISICSSRMGYDNDYVKLLCN